ncbi:hypothetical protein ABZ721_17010 [Streptomyces sp. NPDC006733]|uniref:hypothetical protein n=1 Tax=Streptomyces sp. NPDC006733 TaxID=3155460 RepID=UPI0033E51F12
MTDQSIAPQDEKPQDEKPQDVDPQGAEPAGQPHPEQQAEPEPAPVPVAAAHLPPVPPLPAAPPPADAWAASVPVLPVEPKKPRRVLRAALRWTAAVLVFGALGGGAAYGITQPERTEIPGLKTPDDGRWEYQPLALPKLPAGKPAAFDTEHNPGGRHYADVRSLLLPLPEGAKPDPAFPGEKGWLPTDRYLKLYAENGRVLQGGYLAKEGLRHIAARAWTMPDGTRAEVYLLQFATSAYSDRYRVDAAITSLELAPSMAGDLGSQTAASEGGPITYAFEGRNSTSSMKVRYSYIAAGDTLGVVVLSHAGAMPAVPFRQAITLQAQLLG